MAQTVRESTTAVSSTKTNQPAAIGRPPARWLKWLLWSRFRFLRDLAWRLAGLEGELFSPSDSAIRLLVGGDVVFDRVIRSTQYQGVHRLDEGRSRGSLRTRVRLKLWAVFSRFFLSPRFFSTRVKRVSFPELRIKSSWERGEPAWDRYNRDCVPFSNPSSVAAGYDYPFGKIASFLRERDLVLVNLETPLTHHPRVRGFFRSDPHYAQAMKEAGISIVSLANNHIFDVGEIGFLETLWTLQEAGILYTGAGSNLQEARKGCRVRIDDTEIAFLNYTQFCNASYSSIAAEYPGILPLDRQLILEDIEAVRGGVDLIFVVLHWGFEGQPNVHPKQVEIAHKLVDAGADGIIGHHPHVPHGIEVYKGQPILYSLGNFIFGHGAKRWSDNFLAEIVINQKRIQGIILYPVSGCGEELLQPRLLNGTRAEALLHELQIKSAVFGTGIAIQDGVGYIKIQ
ncbi:MAG: CapA family protein [Anaerolineae bacterium]|nr:CapA family protein [Anaerolineae bacterium]